MADKVVTLTEPTENEIREVSLLYVDGEIFRAHISGTTSGDDGKVRTIEAFVDAADMIPGQVQAIEQLLGKMIGDLRDQNGF